MRRLLSLFLPLFPLSDGRIPLFPVMPIVVAFLRNYSSRASHFCHRRSGNITAAVAKIIFGPSLSVRPKEEMMQWREKRGGKEQEGKKSIRLQITLLASPLLLLLPSRSTDVFPFDCKLLFGDGCGGGGDGLCRNHIFTLGCGPPRRRQRDPSPPIRVSVTACYIICPR